MTATPLSSSELRQYQFFAGIPDDNLWHLARRMSTTEYDANDLLFSEGDQRSMFGIITHGSVAIEKGREGQIERLATLDSG